MAVERAWGVERPRPRAGTAVHDQASTRGLAGLYERSSPSRFFRHPTGREWAFSSPQARRREPNGTFAVFRPLSNCGSLPGMAVRQARGSYRQLAILAAAAVACSCGGSAPSGGPVTIAEIWEGTDARHLILSVRSCLGKPTASFMESRDEVDLLVESTTSTGN